MTNTAHTPGPWSIQGESDYIDIGYSSGRICMMECEDDQQTPEQTYANARLIAAAPDLLAALEAALPIIDAYRRVSGGDGDIAAMNARAVISKAKGE